MNVCGGYRTESFGIIVWKRYDKKYRTDNISVDYIGNDHDKTIKRHTLAKGPGDTRYNTSIILHTSTRYHVSMDFAEW